MLVICDGEFAICRYKLIYIAKCTVQVYLQYKQEHQTKYKYEIDRKQYLRNHSEYKNMIVSWEICCELSAACCEHSFDPVYSPNCLHARIHSYENNPRTHSTHTNIIYTYRRNFLLFYSLVIFYKIRHMNNTSYYLYDNNRFILLSQVLSKYEKLI